MKTKDLSQFEIRNIKLNNATLILDTNFIYKYERVSNGYYLHYVNHVDNIFGSEFMTESAVKREIIKNRFLAKSIQLNNQKYFRG